MKKNDYIVAVVSALLAGMTVVSCNKDDVVEAEPSSPDSTLRPATNQSSPLSVKVYEYTPAPGQFINENMDGVTTPEAACKWAQERLDKGLYVSLGGFGGYIVVGFDHSISAAKSGYDFAIMGNAFHLANTKNGGSNEPGIVWVMQDANGNGEPDDTWCELTGSDSNDPATIHNYSVTYTRPDGDGKDVTWTDNQGGSGKVKYMATIHKQPTYYPLWVKADSYTLSGTCLESHASQNPLNMSWSIEPYGWGYADNMGSDLIDGSDEGMGQRCGFAIRNAVTPDGKSAALEFIDFIKVQTGVNANAGGLGELSTEVLQFQDLSLMQ